MTLTKTHQTQEEIHVVLSPWDLSDSYNRHAGVTIESLLEHCSLPTTIHLLHDERLGSDEDEGVEFNKSCYNEIVENYNSKLQFHHVELPDWVDEMPATKQFTAGTLLRLQLPELLPNIDKVLYLDCDMVVLTDISKLWNTNLDKYYLGACIDTGFASLGNITKKYWKNRGIPTDNYFNAGMLLLNLNKLRESSFSQKAFNYLNKHRDVQLLDQDVLNWFCQDEYLMLDEKYNIFTHRNDAENYLDDCILHYTSGGRKPWNVYSGPIDNYYWKYLIKTPWCKTEQQMIDYIREAPDINKSRQLLSKNFPTYLNGTNLHKLYTSLKFTYIMWKSIFWKGIEILKHSL